jgi:heat-inducible transcriptional repressor
VVEAALKLIDNALEPSGEEVHMEGVSYLAEQPEFQNSQVMEQVLRLVEGKAPLIQILGRPQGKPGLKVDIGREIHEASLRAFSFVHIPYYYRGQVAGALGVLGPTRMAYDRVAGVVRHMAQCVESALSQTGA